MKLRVFTSAALVAFTLVALTNLISPVTAQEGADGQTELLQNGSLEGDLAPWWTTDTINVEVTDEGACFEITDAGENLYDAIVGQHDIPVMQGAESALSFRARADEPLTVDVVLQQNGGDFVRYFETMVELTPEWTEYSYDFASEATNEAGTFQFHVGAGAETTLCLAEISLMGQAGEVVEEEPLPSIRVNQHAYLPSAVKVASIVNESEEPLEWTLKDESGETLLSGETTVFGMDESSQDTLHTADFSDFGEEGSGYTVEVADETSHPFDISANAYETLTYDALRYYYHNRSGIEIEETYTGGGQGSYAADATWARPAGHVSEEPNQGDAAVPCWPESEGAPTFCDYTLDVTKGWYDAGDHGKYVVNSGISTWTLMNLYERSQLEGSSLASLSFADDTLNLPESGNGVSDLLDEVRWNLEFMLAMQVPEGDLAGMVHHKVHDFNWTGLGLAPHEDPQTRYLVPPTVTATLDLAATAAQCARIWQDIDAEFSERCLSAAESAWEAAQANPELYYDDCCNNGGGPYGDDDASDEFYWAATELFITTGDESYKTFMEGSEDYLELPVEDAFTDVTFPTSMTWWDTAALGNLSLLSAPDALGEEALTTLETNLLEAADHYVEVSENEGYGLPFTLSEMGFPWGSNSFVLNNAIVLGVAYDLSDEPAYLNAVTQSMDYLLGRNAMDQSYLTGYGDRPLQNPHHRFWAAATDSDYPTAPPGAVSGGPNSGLEDPIASARLGECAPQKCFLDHIDAWSTNEITINWNAPLAWVAAFLSSLE